MAAKSFKVSADGSTYYQLPGNTADLSVETGSADDSVFGTTFTSNQTTIKSFTSSASAFINKGKAGYRATVKRAGSPTSFSDDLVQVGSSNVYEIADRSKSIWEAGSITVEDGSTDVTEDVTIDFLQGRVIFDSAPSGTVSVSGNYLGTERVCYAQSIDLTQSLDAEDITDFCQADDSDGWAYFAPQQQSVEISLSGFYNDSSTFGADVEEDETVIVEVDVEGNGHTVARGYFKASSQSQSGDVGSTETEDVTYTLFVPEGVPLPFSWRVSSDSAMPEGAKVVLDAWEKRNTISFKYQAQDSSVVREGTAWVSDASISVSVDDIATMSISFQGHGPLERN